MDTVTTRVIVWWDDIITLWTLQSLNAAGDPIGESWYYGNKAEAKRTAKGIAGIHGAILQVGTRKGFDFPD